MNIKQFISTKAFIVHQNKVLILREADEYEDGYNAGTYEIPGGRVEPGEFFNDGLLREIKEEVGLTSITVGKPFFIGEYRPIVRDEQWQVVAIYFECSTDNNEIVLSKDHDGYEWIDPKTYEDYPLKSVSKKAFAEFIKNFKHK
ncbi:NUDIX domain-containing protein [Candidatus Falkowbacteria bacterium]|nr:NUDIX domain-containing protein [Candidatus Falkowbacteria bacterium]